MEGLARARDEGFSLVLLVGDMPYYGLRLQPVPLGRSPAGAGRPPARLLAVELVPGALAGAAGVVKGYAR